MNGRIDVWEVLLLLLDRFSRIERVIIGYTTPGETNHSGNSSEDFISNIQALRFFSLSCMTAIIHKTHICMTMLFAVLLKISAAIEPQSRRSDLGCCFCCRARCTSSSNSRHWV